MRLSVKIVHWNDCIQIPLGEMCFLEKLQKYQKRKPNFENFESALYSKSGSMPLIEEYTKYNGRETV